jgi:lipoyl(octanoyl) transferase
VFLRMTLMAQNHEGSAQICEVFDLGLMPYEQAWNLQKALVEQLKTRSYPEQLLLVEHPPVYTLGQGSTLEFLKFSPQAPPYPLFRIERGGEVTHHCPGQLVGYPILNLKHHQQDLHWYLRQLEDVLIGTLAYFEVQGERLPGLTGVWVKEQKAYTSGEYRKLAAIGIKVSRWITMHGFALNVCPDLSGFEYIVPCGIAHKPVGSLAQFCPGISVEQVKPVILSQFAAVFDVQMVEQAELPSVAWH